MSALSVLASRVDRDAVRTFLAGDLLAILAFLVAGGHRHGTLSDPERFLPTALSFLVGWLVLAPLAGAYSARLRSGGARLLAVTVATWLLVAVWGQALRATDAFPGNADPAFFLVTVGFGSVLLVAWRFLRVRFGSTPRATTDADAR